MAKIFCVVLIAVCAQCDAAVGVRLVFGLADRSQVRWDGSASARGARITSIDPWRFDGDDAIQPGNAWRAATHPIRLFGGQLAQMPNQFVANGVIVWLADERDDAELAVKTAQGEFAVRLADIPYGTMKHFLNDRAMADRIPPVTRITDSPEEQDYPAAAIDKSGNVWLVYVEFKHNPNHRELRAPLEQAPANFNQYREAPGGDQILARKFSGGAWGEPVAITAAGGDLYRPAIAVDGSGRPWVFWSANEKGNFDVWARAIENGAPGRTVRISMEAGSDIDPAAVTDAQGRVWVVWQGWRNGRASIFSATQQGNGFSKPATVSSSPGNEWNPAIAADSSGNVTAAWDSYRNGNYDIYRKTAKAPGQWGREAAVAVSAKYEAYPSLAYDPSGRLWVAYEEGGERWGKDFGAYETSGLAIYQGRAIRVLAFDKNGQAQQPASDVSAVLPGMPDRRIDSAARQNDSPSWITPDPAGARNRGTNRAAANVQAPRNTLPRLRVDASGRVWLAVRSAQPIWWNPVGTVWTEHVVSYDGSKWTGSIYLDRSDNLLDNRPALVALRAGELLVIGSSDGRRQFPTAARRAMGPQTPIPVADPYNNDLYASVISLPAAGAPVATKQAEVSRMAAADPMDKVEKSAVAALRNLRVHNLRPVRGEFHRHSEISMDGGNDGTILDQWRYIIDASAMDWVGCCDHDNGGGREYTWWITQKQTDIFYHPGHFAPMFSYERSVAYPEGHRNIIFAQRGVRTLPRLPKTENDSSGHAPDTLMLYAYLKTFDGIVASHTSGTNMGTDWRDNDPLREPVVEIYQGDRQNYEMPDAPRSNSANDSIGGWRPKGFVNLALEMGYKMGFQASSDHISTHMSYCNIFVTDVTREAVLDGFKKRHVYGATENILADVRSGDHMMGDEFTTSTAPELRVKLTGTRPFAKVHIIKDNRYVYAQEPKAATVDFTWKDNEPKKGSASYYYVRGEQDDGNIVWVSPMWITYK